MGEAASTFKQEIIPLLKGTIASYQRHHGQWLAAAIAYFAVFATAPLIIVVVGIAGLVLGHHEAILKEIYSYLQATAGKSAADGLAAVVTAGFAAKRTGFFAQIVAWIVFGLAALGLFTSLQEAFNIVWDVDSGKQNLLKTLRERALSFGVVVGIALVLLAGLAASTVLTIVTHRLTELFPSAPALTTIAGFVASVAAFTVLFALLFEYLPERHVDWRDVWHGAAATSLLFVTGQFLLAWYLGRAGISSTFGVFGSLVLFMLWVNYSTQILLLGAEFTQVYAKRRLEAAAFITTALAAESSG
jgi:membrane protein